MPCDIAIIGAGPYGLAAAAHLRRLKSLTVSIFGEPMRFWRAAMPAGMLLRSAWSASHIAGPHASLTLDAYKVSSGNHLAAPISLERFIDYGLWYQRTAVPDVDRRSVSSIEPHAGKFQIRLEDGSDFLASRVVIVIGGGQSALESAALLHELGAEVEVLVRRSRVHWLGWKDRLSSLGSASDVLFSPTDVGPAGISRLVAAPDLLRKFPHTVRTRLRLLSTRPAGARWLRERLNGVRLSTRTTVTSALPVNGHINLTLSDNTTRRADHVLLGTGYRVDVARYPFLGPGILRQLQSVDGFPILGPALESSIPGLHFLGAPAAWSYGPLMCFVSGTKYAADALVRHFSLATRVAA